MTHFSIPNLRDVYDNSGYAISNVIDYAIDETNVYHDDDGHNRDLDLCLDHDHDLFLDHDLYLDRATDV